MRKVGIGIIGCGGIANMHAGAVAGLADEVDFVAVCDTVEARAQAMAKQYNVPGVYTDSRKMLADPKVEAVLVCTPHPSHCLIAMQAADAGKHVMTEKPLSVDLKQADQAIEAAKKAGIKFACIFQRRFWPAAQRARKAIDEGRLGKIIVGDCQVKWWRDKAYYDRDAWRGTWNAEGGGVMVNQAVHAIDMYQWLMGPIDTIYGQWGNLSHPYIEVEDNAVAAIRFKNGAVGTILTTVSSKPQLGSRIAVTGDNGNTVSVLEHPEGRYGVNEIWEIPGETEAAAKLLAEELEKKEFMFQSRTDAQGNRVSERNVTCHQLQIQDFANAIRDNREPAVSAEEGRKAIEIIMAIYQSGRTGQPIKFPFYG